ncbi:MAG: aminotransferase class V-fold PLP-dependent enzyme [Planctomycetes bacterium]|nr:aminotransferase class V-fold PLP-dependent enzyme [Planctomycetota bacterium]
MTTSLDYKFKIAAQPWEFDEIKKLNYETFVKEIPQHKASKPGMLIDKFHDENTYIICVSEDELLGMLAVRAKRPFSLDKKIDNLDSYLPADRTMCEVRLLAAKKTCRHSRVLRGLLAETVKYCEDHEYDLAIISGVLNQQRLYRHLGFVPFGPIVGSEDARFQPMYLTVQAHAKSRRPLGRHISPDNTDSNPNFLPGPVNIAPSVGQAFSAPAISHRCDEYIQIHNETRELLKKLVNSKQVEIFAGSGTLANDVIAGQLSLLSQKGLILSNGEFGKRIINQAARFDLNFKTISIPSATPFNTKTIEKEINRMPDIKWIWAVHCETSTGMLNDVDMLKKISAEHEILLCLDCISSVGNINVDLQDVYLASAVSSKGLASFPGLSMVFYNHQIKPPKKNLPACIDLQKYAASNGIPFTISSNLVCALRAAIKNLDIDKKLEQTFAISALLRRKLLQIGISPIVSEEHASTQVITIQLDKKFDSGKIGDQLKDAGFLLSYQSSYLLKHNWIQICLMSDFSTRLLKAIPLTLERLLAAYHNP